MNQINYIYQQYMKILNRQPNFDLIIQSLSGCSNTDEMKKILKQISLKDNSFDERINAEIILKSIRNQIIMRNQQMNNTLSYIIYYSMKILIWKLLKDLIILKE